MEENYPAMELYCQNNSEFVFREDTSGYTFSIPCDIVAQGSEAIVDYGVNSLIEQVYYEDYDCEFWDCIGKTSSPLFLISEKAKNYWNSKFYLALMASVVLAALTTVLGMIPLLFDAFFISMAVTIMFGLTFATLLTLIMVPVLYSMFFQIE